MRTRGERIRVEILIVLAVTFGLSGVRSLLRLVDALLAEPALNEHARLLIQMPIGLEGQVDRADDRVTNHDRQQQQAGPHQQ